MDDRGIHKELWSECRLEQVMRGDECGKTLE